MTAAPTQSTNPMGRQRWRESAILLLLVYNVFVGGTTYGLLVFYPRLVTQTLYFGLVALWLINLLRQRRPFPRSPLDLPLMLLGGIILGATIFSVEPRLSLDDIPLYFTYVMFYYMVIDCLRAGWQVSAFLKGLMMTMIVVCIFAGLEYLGWYTGLPLFPTFKQGWWPIGGWRDPVPPYWYRLSYTLNNPNILSSLLALVLPIGVAVVVIAGSRWTRINAIAWVLVNTLVLLLTFSRGGLLAALVGLLTLAFIIGRQRGFALCNLGWLARNRHRVLLVSMGALVIVLLIAFFIAGQLNRPEGYYIRLALWRYALQIMRDHPLLGTGPRTFGTVILHYWDLAQYPTSYVFSTAHNVFLHAGAEIGVPGALIIVLIPLLVAWTAFRQCIRLPFRQSVLVAGVLSGLVAFGAHSIVDNLLAVPAVVLPVIVLAAICSIPYGDTLSPTHPLLTPRRGLLLTVIVAGLVTWSFYGQASFRGIATDAQSRQWSDVVQRLDKLPTGIFPRSFYDFQRGLAYGKLALNDPTSDTMKIAITSYRDGLEMVPEYVPGHANLAALYWRLGDVPQARRELQVAIAHEPDEILYQLNLGLLYEQQGDDAAAIAMYAQMLATNPSLASSVYWQETDWRRQHWPLIRNGAETRIQHVYGSGVVSIRKGELAYFSGDLSRAADLLRLGMTTADSSEANVWLSLALIDQGHFQEAISILNGVLEATQSSNALAYTSRGWANLALGREDAATHDLKIALFLGDVRAQYYLGQLALTNGDVGTAISLYRQSLPAPRSLLQVNLRYDFLFYRQGGIYESNLLPLAALPPAVPVAETYLELADLYADQGEIEAAREICQQLLALSSDYQPARDKLRALSR